jgi:uncharacterized repeat protein (TIGR01451 family)
VTQFTRVREVLHSQCAALQLYCRMRTKVMRAIGVRVVAHASFASQKSVSKTNPFRKDDMNAIARGAILALMLGCGLAEAQQGGPIETRLEARKVVRAADGKEGFAEAAAARPGDVIEYTATYRNTSKQAVRDLEATLPIPPNTEYVPGSAKPAAVKASVDSRNWGTPPLVRKVVRDGRSIEEQVPVREYRYLRWFPGELGGEKAVSFTARVRVVDDLTPSEPGKGGTK